MSGWTYGGTASNPSVSGNSGSGSVTYNYKVSTAADSTYTATKPSNAGTYTVYYKVEKLGLIKSLYYLVNWAIMGFIKYRK